MDGHRSHMSIELSQFCDDNDIILYALPPNATHLMQPADVSLFKPLKEYWRQNVRTWHNQNMEKTFTKLEFAPIFKQALENINIPNHIKKGFQKCGLFPYNPEAVDYSKCVQNELEHLQQVNAVETELTVADFESTHKVLKNLKSSMHNEIHNVDWIIQELKAFEKKVLQENSGVKDMIVDEDIYIEEYEVTNDGILVPIQKNKPFIQEPKINILRIDVLRPDHSEINNPQSVLQQKNVSEKQYEKATLKEEKSNKKNHMKRYWLYSSLALKNTAGNFRKRRIRRRKAD